MISTKKMIIVNVEIKTSKINKCVYNAYTKKWDIEYINNIGNFYSYSYSNVEYLKDYILINPDMYQIEKSGNIFNNIEKIMIFKGKNDYYWHICFKNGIEKDYCQSELNI